MKVLVLPVALLLSARGLVGQPAMPAPVRSSDTVIQPGGGPPVKDVGFDQRLGEAIPLDAAFKDETGRSVVLGDYFHGKPVLLSLVYYGCPMICGLTTEGLVRSLRALSWDAGAQFNVLTVSFDPREGAAQASERKRGSLAAYGRAGASAGWHFLTGSEESIRRLTKSVGFRYVWDEESKQFAHATGIVALTPEGKIAKYFFGIEYAPKDLKFGLMEASEKRIGTLVDQLLLLCYHYDPKMGRYTPAVLNLVRAAAVLTLALMGGFIWTATRRERKERRLANVA